MGAFYGHVVVIGADLESLTAALPRPALLAEPGDPDLPVVVFAEADEPVPTSGEALSAELGCLVVSFAVVDDDLVLVQVHRDGRLLVEGAVPDPVEVFGVADEDDAGTLDPAALVGALGFGDVDRLGSVLAADHLFATDLHQDLVDALGLPTWPVGWGYRYLTQDTVAYAGPPLTHLP